MSGTFSQLIMGVVVLTLLVSCPGANGGPVELELEAVSGLSPADGASTTETTPTFSWDAVPGAAGYELQLADSAAEVEAAPTQSVTDTSYTPSSALNGQTHWRVRAVDGDGQGGPWSAVVTIHVNYSIGDTGPAGGIVFYDKGSYSDGWRYLEAAPSDQGSSLTWEGDGIEVGGTGTAIGSGKSNTEKIVTALGTGNYAARLCYDLELGGYDDWFLPSKDELNELNTQKDIVGGFASDDYWSSSESNSFIVWLQFFNKHNDAQYTFGKIGHSGVRAVRAF